MIDVNYFRIAEYISDELEPDPLHDLTDVRHYRRRCGALIGTLDELVRAVLCGDIHYQHQIDGYLRRGLITPGEARVLAERARVENGGQV